MRTTQLEKETRTIIDSLPGFRMERSDMKKYNRAVFDLYKDDVCVGMGFTCDQLQAIATVQGNISLMEVASETVDVQPEVKTSIITPENNVRKLIIPGQEDVEERRLLTETDLFEDRFVA